MAQLRVKDDVLRCKGGVRQFDDLHNQEKLCQK